MQHAERFFTEIPTEDKPDITFLSSDANRFKDIDTHDIMAHDADWNEENGENEEDHYGKQEDLKDSIKQEGMKEPIEAHKLNSGEYALANGHHRLAAARDLGHKYVPVRRSQWM
jgi:ParB-like chromosome segregation protein Spo0J